MKQTNRIIYSVRKDNDDDDVDGVDYIFNDFPNKFAPQPKNASGPRRRQ